MNLKQMASDQAVRAAGVSTANDGFDEFRETLGTENVDTFLSKFGMGPKYVPTEPKFYHCDSCGLDNVTCRERHPDTSMNHMAYCCPDCGNETEASTGGTK